MKSSASRIWVIIVALMVMFALVVMRERRNSATPSPVEAVVTSAKVRDITPGSTTRESSMAEVLQLARESLEAMEGSIENYTARFIKQERDPAGVLGEEAEMKMKVMTRHRDGKLDAPMRVYLDFVRPTSQQGREVIWAEDLHDGQLVVHEGGLMGLLTVKLDPNGFLAMRGQRFPISNIGLTRLVEQLIERGKLDESSPDITVTITPGYKLGSSEAELIQVRRAKPSGRADDFSLAEIAFDRSRLLILQYRSFGWPATPDEPPPLLESYTYLDIETNVGLSDLDFDPENPAYRYP